MSQIQLPSGNEARGDISFVFEIGFIDSFDIFRANGQYVLDVLVDETRIIRKYVVSGQLKSFPPPIATKIPFNNQVFYTSQ